MDFEYGEKLIRNGFWVHNFKNHAFRYRIDPVPGTGFWCRWNFRDYYKKMSHALNERRMCFSHKEYIRGKRSLRNLPNPWDDVRRGDIRTRKSWKNKRIRKQWMKNFPTSTPIRNLNFSKEWDDLIFI